MRSVSSRIWTRDPTGGGSSGLLGKSSPVLEVEIRALPARQREALVKLRSLGDLTAWLAHS
ncbi:hypothetical protein L1047_13740 [Synechococcus sp. Nb3U1]|uniref:hypothetical protein n=1 Tax=Synechococcus sp. Nb3U1 TaxID=1914529 RepID=UPI001F31F2E3|nr:hypothetical protein [Synechococcus sp. Nb3U1]MCF2972259.1 hypothetical protein [Synechococcus sp. Nb3U1]